MGNISSDAACNTKELEDENIKLERLHTRYENEYQDYKDKVEKLCEQNMEKLNAKNNILKNLVETNREKRNHWRELYNSHKS